MDNSWSFLNHLSESEKHLLENAYNKYGFNYSGHNSSSEILSLMNMSPSTPYVAIPKSIASRYHGEYIHVSNSDYQAVAILFLNIMLTNDDKRREFARIEHFSNEKEKFRREYALKISTSNSLLQKLPLYLLVFSGFSAEEIGPSLFSWSGSATTLALGVSAVSISGILSLTTILGPIALFGYAAKKIFDSFKEPDYTMMYAVILFLHIEHTFKIRTLDEAKQFCKDTISYAENYQYDGGLKMSPIRMLFIIHLVKHVFSIEDRYSDRLGGIIYDLNHIMSKHLENYGQDYFETIISEYKFGQLTPYAHELIDYLYGYDIPQSESYDYTFCSNGIQQLAKSHSGPVLLVDYQFPFSRIDSDTFCLCSNDEIGLLSCLYYELNGFDSSNRCIGMKGHPSLYNYICYFDLVVAKHPSKEIYDTLSRDGLVVNRNYFAHIIFTDNNHVIKRPTEISREDIEREKHCVRHNIIKELVTVYEDLNEVSTQVSNISQLDDAILRIKAHVEWLKKYFAARNNPEAVDIIACLREEEKFASGFSVEFGEMPDTTPKVVSSKAMLHSNVFSNLFHNFNKHAFVNSQTNNIVHIDVYTDEQYTEVRISNNGTPLDRTLADNPNSIFEFGTMGPTTGNSGVGCWSIRKTMIDSGGDARVEISDNIFPVTFVLTFVNNSN